MTSKLDQYRSFTSLSDKQKKALLATSVAFTEHEPNPLGNNCFPDMNFIDFQVHN